MSRREIILEGGKPWGFRIKGGSEFNIPISIEEVTSPKAKNAGLLKNDVVYEINGHNVEEVSHKEAKDLIINAGHVLRLSVQQSTGLRHSRSLLGNKKPAETPSPVATPASRPEPVKEEKKQPVSPAVETCSQIQEKPVGTEERENGLSNATDVKSPFLRSLMSENSSPGGRGGLTIVKPGVTLDKPVGGTSSLTIGARPNPNQRSSVQIGGGVAAAKQRFSAIPAGSLGGRVTEPLGRGGDAPTGTTKVQIVTSATFTCKRCNEPILEGQAVSVAGYYYHPEHFTCKNCNERLTETKIFKDNSRELICETCYAKSTDRKCAACSKPVVGQYLTANGKNYHLPCFKCLGCGKNLETCGFIDKGVGLQCQDCYNEECGTKCTKCMKFILPGESYVNIDGNNMHSTCFVCAECKEVLSSFKQRDGAYICPKH